MSTTHQTNTGLQDKIQSIKPQALVCITMETERNDTKCPLLLSFFTRPCRRGNSDPAIDRRRFSSGPVYASASCQPIRLPLLMGSCFWPIVNSSLQTQQERGGTAYNGQKPREISLCLLTLTSAVSAVSTVTSPISCRPCRSSPMSSAACQGGLVGWKLSVLWGCTALRILSHLVLNTDDNSLVPRYVNMALPGHD